jgi:hypothetical protein
MAKKVWHCVCGKTKKESDKLLTAVEASCKANEQWEKKRRKQEDERIARGVPIGDCSDCRARKITCDFSCVGV